MIVYIAGKMTGLPDKGKAKFDAAADDLRQYAGCIVLNPADLPDGMPKEKYMPICLAMIDAADAICPLDDWEDSPGAMIEISYARYQGKNILPPLNTPTIIPSDKEATDEETS